MGEEILNWLRARTAPIAVVVLTGALLAFGLATLLGSIDPDDGITPFGLQSDPYQYWQLVVLLFIPYGVALLACARGNPPSARLLWSAAAIVMVPLLLAKPIQSHDVYEYLFYGRMQVVHHANPYLVEPAAFSSDTWFAHVGWTRSLSVYGPLWNALMALVVAVTGGSLTAALLLAKAITTVGAIAGALGLSRIRTSHSARLVGLGAVATLVFAMNPLVLTTAVLGGHADALLAAAFAWAIVFDQRGRTMRATLLLVLATLVKLYALPVLVIYLYVLWRRHGFPIAVRHFGLGLAVTVLAWAPYWRGPRTLDGLQAMRGRESEGLFQAVRLQLLAWFGHLPGVDPTTLAASVTTALSYLLLAGVALALIRSRRTKDEPWRAAALFLVALFVAAPWYMPWYAVGPLALVVPLAGSRLRPMVLTFSASCLIQTIGVTMTVQALLRYGPPALVGVVSGLMRRSPRRGEEATWQRRSLDPATTPEPTASPSVTTS